MPEIRHKLNMSASPSEVHGALTRAGLGATSARRDETEFRMGAVVARMRTTHAEHGSQIAWQCIDGPADWIGTVVRFDLTPEGERTVVRFRHEAWREMSDSMGDSSARWASFLFHLKWQLEAPEPDDLFV